MSGYQTHDHDVVVNQANEYNYSDRVHTSADSVIMEEYTEKPAAPTKRPFYKKRKYWVICAILTIITVIVVVCLALFVFFPMIAQSLMNQAGIKVNAAQISFTKPESLNSQTYSKRETDNLNSTFYMNMESSLSNTGPFHAKIKFRNPVEVYYQDQLLGNIFFFNETHIAGGKGSLDASTPFLIKDEVAFTNFAKNMLADEEFKWTLKGKLDITALSRTATVKLNKEITLKGMNGFPQVKINSFELPGDAPEGGILVELGTVLTSPSPIGVELGTIALAIGYDGVSLGKVVAQNVKLQEGDNNILLKGTLTPHADADSLTKVGNLFSNYVSGQISNTTAVGISAAPDGVNAIGWLSEGFKTVQLNVALGATEPLKIIKAVSMGYLDLVFDAANPYNPTVNAPNVVADFEVPFGFSLNISQVTQTIALGLNSTSGEVDEFARINVPYVPSVSDQKTGKLNFAIENNNIVGISGKEPTFNAYTYALTANGPYSFVVSGNASTVTSTPIGTINLAGISFTVPTTLNGLQFLNSTATIINSLDVTGGTSENLLLAIDVTMTNPSDFGIATGDVNLIMGSSGVDLGIVTLSNLVLARGDNQVLTTATFNPKSSDVGQNLLSTFVMGQDNAVEIKGFEGSTNIASLSEPLSQVSIGTNLPGLTTALIQGGAMAVSDDTPSTGVVNVKVAIANPFSAGLSITKVISSASFDGMPVGNIDQDISSNPFNIPGKSTAESPELSMTMNVDPSAVALLLRTLAVKSNMDTTALDAMLTLGGLSVEGQQQINGDSSTFAGFDITVYVKEAMQALRVDLILTSTLSIGEYVNDLSFSQGDVAISTDDSITKLIPIVGQPIVQQIVNGAVLGFESIVLSAPTEGDFTVQMKGSITNAGPMDAIIAFTSSLTVAWEGKVIGTVSMPEIHSKADVGASFDVTGAFTVADGNNMAEFAAYLINSQSFVWDITTEGVSVTALGFTFTGISMSKSVTLLGANSFKDSVTIQSFDLPANDPAGGITLTAQTTIKNPSQVGFDLAGVSFETLFGGVDLGPLASDGAAVFPPQGEANIPMKGRLIPQTSPEGLAAIAQVFDNYLGGKPSLVDVQGVSGSGPNGQVGWLTSAFKTLLIKDVVLPGPAAVPELIPAITMKDLTLDFTQDPWAPPTASQNVEAQLKNPFGFPLSVAKLNMNVDATYGGNAVASLAIPDEEARTSSTGLITTQFSNVPFKVANKELFTGFVKLLTLGSDVSFGLKGASNAVAQTAVGTLNLNNIGFDVTTNLRGFNNFGGSLTINSLAVTGGTPEYTSIDLTFTLSNPSNITINVGDINFDVIMNEFDAVLGRVYVENAIIPPGDKVYSAQLRLGEKSTSDKAIGQMFSNFLTAADIPLTIKGHSESTPIVPLSQGLSAVSLKTTAKGIQANLIKQIDVKGGLIDLLIKNKGTSIINLQNPLDTDFAITAVEAAVTFSPSIGDSTPYTVGRIKYNLPSPQVVPAKGSAKTQEWPVEIDATRPTHLIDMVIMLLDPKKYFDVEQNVTVTVGDGFQTSMYYYQKKVPFSLQIDGLPALGGENGINLPSLPDLSTLSNLKLSNIDVSNPTILENTIKALMSGQSLTGTALDVAALGNATEPAVEAASVVAEASTNADLESSTTTSANIPATTTEPVIEAATIADATVETTETTTVESSATATGISKLSDLFHF